MHTCTLHLVSYSLRVKLNFVAVVKNYLTENFTTNYSEGVTAVMRIQEFPVSDIDCYTEKP